MSQQATLMKFDPATGWGNPYPSESHQWREFNGTTGWLFNPWTGIRRTAEDVDTDVFGQLILPPDEPVVAAQASPAKPDLSDEQIEAIFHALDGKKLIVGENSLNWNKVVRLAFARALLAAITKEASHDL